MGKQKKLEWICEPCYWHGNKECVPDCKKSQKKGRLEQAVIKAAKKWLIFDKGVTRIKLVSALDRLRDFEKEK